MDSAVLNVGDSVERLIDRNWYLATVVDITEVEVFHGGGSSSCIHTYDIEYLDDGKVEANVDRLELRPATLTTSSPALTCSSRKSHHQTTIPTFFPGCVALYRDAAEITSSGTSPAAKIDTAVLVDPIESPLSKKEDLRQAQTCISLTTFRQILKELSRPPVITASRISCDNDCDMLAKSPSHHKFKLRRHSMGSVPLQPVVGSARQPTAIRWAPFADHCVVCRKWTVYRCVRCSRAFYCSRRCQTQAWPEHSLTCNYLEFRITLNLDKIETRHRQLIEANKKAGCDIHPTSGVTSMNPMHKAGLSANAICNNCSVTSTAPIQNTLRLKANSDLEAAHGSRSVGTSTEVEMTDSSSWYHTVKQGGARFARQTRSSGVDTNDVETSSSRLNGQQTDNFTTPPRSNRRSVDDSAVNKFTAEDIENLASMLNVQSSVAADALRRSDGDANAAAEWLLSMPNYVAVNSSQADAHTSVHPKPLKKPETRPYIYPTNDISVIDAQLDRESPCASHAKLFAGVGKELDDDDGSWGDSIELYSGQFSIRGRICDVVVTQKSRHDYTTTVTIYPKGRAILCPSSITSSAHRNESSTIISSNAKGGIDKKLVCTADIKALSTAPGVDGIPAGFDVVYLSPPTALDMNAIDDDVYTSAPPRLVRRAHVIMVLHSSLPMVLRQSCADDGTNWEGLMEISDSANFQRARRILHGLTPQYVNVFGPTVLSASQQMSTIPIGGISRFPEYYILVYKIFETNKVLSAQSVRPERVYIELGKFDANNFSSVLSTVEADRDELFRGSRTKPTPFISSNPFDEEPTFYDDKFYDNNDIPELIDVGTDTSATKDVNPHDIQVIVDMFGLPASEALSFLKRANGNIESAVNLILN